MTQLTNNKFAVALIHTLSRHEYFYGNDVEGVFHAGELAKREITNNKVEWVELRTYTTESKMLEYITKKKAFYDEEGLRINFTEVNNSLPTVKVS